ncbi:Holliday junction branch migration protein RuvA [Alphaproteobacteria bacterium KMM 3653]|uniref:Holliday junction branch migration complex subunit RuvA n=1 Tax=Harenicola maris TaxID=2841044 RepID=A0AAP2G2S7_9RHOB|nr:Holliday junction branch migration protein RuvA [Harenicola maris]
MIGRLKGRLEFIGSDHVLLDVNGVGYIVYVSERTRMGLPGLGEGLALYTDLLVREDLLQLFGFPTMIEKEWHRLLTSVQGIGAKASMAILGTLGPEGVGRALAIGDAAAIKAAPGVGPKIAARVVNELKDKAPQVMALGGHLDGAEDEVILPEAAPEPAAAKPKAKPKARSGAAAAQADALSALVNLGYGHGDAASAVAQAASDGEAKGEADLIRAALKLLAPKG